jgi:hypothetical protein
MFRRSDIIYFGEGPKKKVTFAEHEQFAQKKFQTPAEREEYLRRATEMKQSEEEFKQQRQAGEENAKKIQNLRLIIEENAKKIKDPEAKEDFLRRGEKILKGKEEFQATKGMQSAVDQAEEIKRLQRANIEDAYLKAQDDSNRLQNIDEFWGPVWEAEFAENPQQKLSKEEFIQKAFPPIDIKKQQMEDAEIWEKQYKPTLRSEGMKKLPKNLDEFWTGWEQDFPMPTIDINKQKQQMEDAEIWEKKYKPTLIPPEILFPEEILGPEEPPGFLSYHKLPATLQQTMEQQNKQEQIAEQTPVLENITLNQPKKGFFNKLKNIFKKNQTPYTPTYKFEEGVDLPINEDINISNISREDFLNKMASETQSPRSVSRQTSEAPSIAETTASEKHFRDKYPDGPPDPIQLGMDINEYYSKRDQPENIYARKKAKALIASPSRYNKINVKEKVPETTYEATTRHQAVLEAKKRTLPPSNFESNEMKRKKELKLQEEQKKHEEQLEKDTDERIDTEIKLIQNKDKIVTRNREELLDLLENNSDFKERGEILNMIKELPPPRSSKGYMRSLDKNNKILNEEDKIKNTTKQRLLDLYKKTKYDKERLDILSIIKNYN